MKIAIRRRKYDGLGLFLDSKNEPIIPNVKTQNSNQNDELKFFNIFTRSSPYFVGCNVLFSRLAFREKLVATFGLAAKVNDVDGVG